VEGLVTAENPLLQALVLLPTNQHAPKTKGVDKTLVIIICGVV